MVITVLIFFFLWFVLLLLPSQHILLTAQQTIWRYTYKIKYRFTSSDCMHNGLKFGVKHSGKRGRKRINGRSRQFVNDPELHAAIQSGEEDDPMFSWKLWYGVSEAPIFKTLKAMTKGGGAGVVHRFHHLNCAWGLSFMLHHAHVLAGCLNTNQADIPHAHQCTFWKLQKVKSVTAIVW